MPASQTTPNRPAPDRPGRPDHFGPPAHPGRPDPAAPRAQAPIRWPHPDRTTLTMIALWALGLVAALVLPVLFVSPSAVTAPAGRLWSAFACTLAGAALMVAAAIGQWRHDRDSSVLTLGVVPAVAVAAGGIILVVTKIFPVPGS